MAQIPLQKLIQNILKVYCLESFINWGTPDCLFRSDKREMKEDPLKADVMEMIRIK
jgi:hypothetical protein